jgi:shikimate kinase
MIDLDSRVSEREGASIPELFRTVGETGFREAERDALQEAVQGLPSVIACGGGVILREDNRRLLSEGGTTVYLSVSLQDVVARVRPDGERPLLASSPHDVGTLLEERLPLYETVADITVETSGRSESEVARSVIEALEAVGK